AIRSIPRWRQCPIHVVHDEKRLNLPPIEFDFLRLVHGVTETKSFAKELSKLHDQIQRAWVKTKEKMLVDTTMSGLNFKHFIDGGEQVCSVRLNKAYGAHLR